MSKEPKVPEKVVYVCTGSKCKKKGGKVISKGLRGYTKENKLRRVSVIKTSCTDRCKYGPIVCLQPDNTWHFYMDEHKAIRLLEEKCESSKSKSDQGAENSDEGNE